MGFLSLIPLPYRLLALCGLAIALFAFGWVKGAAHGERRLEAFQQAQAIEAAKAQALADATDKRNQERKESADASYRKALLAASGDLDRMRKSVAGPYVMPSASPDTGNPERACFDRAELDAAIQRFAQGVSGLVEQGETLRLKLDTAIEWAK